MAEVAHRYVYRHESRCEPQAGDVLIDLATSGGPQAHPHLFEGPLARPRQAARCLLTVASVARTRFHNPIGVNSLLLDPVITVHDDLLRFEAFSSCCSVYARFDQAGAGTVARGTTNIDINPPMRAALSAVRDDGDVLLTVGREQVSVMTAESAAVERTVPLPLRWLKGLVEVQLASAGLVRRLELGALAARRLLQQLPARPGPAPMWVVPVGDGARLSRRPSEEGVQVDAPLRLRPLTDLIPFMQRLVVYAPPPGTVDAGRATASAWEVQLADARLVLVLSPELSRGFSGEGAALVHAAIGDPAAAGAIASRLDGQRHLDPEVLSAEVGLPRHTVTSGIAQLGLAGRLGYDVHDEGYFHRDLPFAREQLERLHPRLLAGRELAASGAVAVDPDGHAVVVSGDNVYRVRVDGPDLRCTCRWYARHAGERGPCKHVLAVQLVRARDADPAG